MIITTLAMTAGVQAHVTVADANNGHIALPNANITWSAPDPQGTGLVITPDPMGGFFFDAVSPGSIFPSATYAAGSVVIHAPQLTVTVSAGVQPEYLSP